MSTEQRAREILANAYERAGYRDEAIAFRAGGWTCHDHPALAAMLSFAAETREACAKVADRHDTGDCRREDFEARRIAAAIRAGEVGDG